MTPLITGGCLTTCTYTILMMSVKGDYLVRSVSGRNLLLMVRYKLDNLYSYWFYLYINIHTPHAKQYEYDLKK